MEIAEQWQREWTGSAEYGKVTEGGVTRNVARAMEVLHASKPGACVRVLRAAYHSSAGPGVPSSSYMLHSSRRVISSGFNYTDPPSLPSLPAKPLEISSTPLDSLPDFNSETENYKVTEPDDLSISEPSKWRGSTSSSTIRLPSEESSSTDNTSIIDVDNRTERNLNRKYSYDSESSDIQWNKGKTRVSPILHAPVALNTLKYKSLLNSSNDWHNRRKSYSFEDTVPSRASMSCGNDTVAIESSTDSGICKSSEIVNNYPTNDIYSLKQDQTSQESNDDTFTSWLLRNRKNNFYNTTKFKTCKEHEIVIEEPNQNNITLQSTGKMTISLPITAAKGCSHQHKKMHTKDDGQRKVKKVEFCKTELHFAAETGKVNIIATDEKPPPSNDFRKRRSVFLPLHDMPEKPITLFGEKINKFPEHGYCEINENDENTAATKSILKNKIPKPKPYLLGENMEFGSANNLTGENRIKETPVLTAVSLINKQLQSQRRYSDEINSSLTRDIDILIHKSIDVRTDEKGPAKDISLDAPEATQRAVREFNNVDHVNSMKNRFHDTERSAMQKRSKTRELRTTDLTYFGVPTSEKEKRNDVIPAEYTISSDDSAVDNIFQSVKLIQKIANSVCSSETELDDTPEYENIPLCVDNSLVPIPKTRTKFDDKPVVKREVRILKPVIEQECHETINSEQPTTRRSRLRREQEIVVNSNRSVSEPPKRYRYNSIETTYGQQNQSSRCVKNNRKGENVKHKILSQGSKTKLTNGNKKHILAEIAPVYVNLNIENEVVHRKQSSPQRILLQDLQRKGSEKKDIKSRNKNLQLNKSLKTQSEHNDSETNNLRKKQRSLNRHPMEKVEVGIKTKNREKVIDNYVSGSLKSNKSINNINKTENNTTDEKELLHKTRTSLNHSTNAKTGNINNDIIKAKNERKITDVNSNDNVDFNRSSYQDNAYTIRKEQPLPKEERNKKNSVPNVNSKQIKIRDNSMKNKESKANLNNYKTTRKNEYVINYDDKSGTVSSVCKIKQGPSGISRKKNIPKEFLDENSKEHPLKNKALNKIALLQFTDQPRPRNGFNYGDRKWKTKMEEQKSCQLL